MREIGTIGSEQAAAVFADYLYTQGIDSTIRQERAGGWAVWIHAEKDIPAAKEALPRFLRDPEGAEYRNAALEAAQKRKQRQQEDEEAGKRIISRRQIFKGTARRPLGPLTAGLVVTSCLVTLASTMGGNDALASLLSISSESGPSLWEGLSQVRSGELWRLVTPIFLHFSVLHILFNMLWLNDLGRTLEGKLGWRMLAALVLVIAVASNLAQYASAGPHFGGMSGVVYGLFGFTWMMGKYLPASGLTLDRTTVITMILWFLLCWTGLMGPIANMAHTAGFCVGMLWGYLAALRGRRSGFRG